MRRRRVALLTLAFLVAACGTQAARFGAPSAPPSIAPSPSPSTTTTPRPLNATNDVLYVRRQRSSSVPVTFGIDVMDARTGTVLRELPNGVVSPDGKLLLRTQWSDGGTRTVVHVTDLATGADVRSYQVDGDLRAIVDAFAAKGVTPDGRWLALSRPPVMTNGQWVTEFATIDVTSGTLRRTGELTTANVGQCCPYDFQALSPDGRLLYISHGESVGVYDVAKGGFLSLEVMGESEGWSGVLTGYRTSFVTQGGIAYRLFATPTEGPPYVLALDLEARAGGRVQLPAEQRTTEFEKYMLWSLAIAPDGKTVYAVNPALGVIDEIDTKALALLRTTTFEVTREDDGGALARLRQLIYPVAQAKRYLRSGAILSPDGATLYAIGVTGIVAIDTATLSSRLLWHTDSEAMIDSLALSPDGARLYAIDDRRGEILILDTRHGMSSLGRVTLSGWIDSIVRIDTP